MKGCFMTEADDMCVACRNAKDGFFCVEQCPDTKYDDNEGACMPCHENCIGCKGPGNQTGSDGCDKCKYLDGSFCVPECPIPKYDVNGTCTCPAMQYDSNGNCTG